MKGAYYNENDEEKAAWLRELIREGIIAAGEVDARSIAAVWPEDLTGFDQCHFFAGIGVWSYALRLAGWPDDRPVWTGSCPCPSFSAAGKGGGFNDPRHLWPDWARLIRKCRPATLFGEQADDAIGYGWLDLVQTDLERENYAVGKAVLGACSVGAPHIRQRLYFVAHAQTAEVFARFGEVQPRAGAHDTNGLGDRSIAERLAHTDSERCGEAGLREGEFRTCGFGCACWRCVGGSHCVRCPGYSPGMADSDRRGQSVCGKPQAQHDGELGGGNDRMGNADRSGEHRGFGQEERETQEAERKVGESDGKWFRRIDSGTGDAFVNGFWRDADWVLRKRWNSDDWEWCPTEPGTFPLVAGATNRVLKLRGYGDAIVPQVAAAFIEAASVKTPSPSEGARRE